MQAALCVLGGERIRLSPPCADVNGNAELLGLALKNSWVQTLPVVIVFLLEDISVGQ